MDGCLVNMSNQKKQDLLKDAIFFVPEKQMDSLIKFSTDLNTISKSFLCTMSVNETKKRMYKSVFFNETKSFMKYWDGLLEKIDDAFYFVLNEKRDFIISNVKASIKRNNKKDNDSIQKNHSRMYRLNEEAVFVDGICDTYNYVSDSIQERLNNLDCLISNLEEKKTKKELSKIDYEKIKENITGIVSLLLNKDSLIHSLIQRLGAYKAKYNSTKFAFSLENADC